MAGVQLLFLLLLLLLLSGPVSALLASSQPPVRPGRPRPPPRTIGSRMDLLRVGGPTTMYDPASFGGDPTGQRDSTAAFAKLIHAAWADATTAKHGCLTVPAGCINVTNLGGAIIDLRGGTFRVNSPVVFPASGGGNLGVQDGTLRAGEGFPAGRFLIELNISATDWPHQTFVDLTFSNLVLDGDNLAGGLSCVNCDHVTIDRCWVMGFQGFGIYTLGGHEVYVSNSWISQNNHPTHPNGTGILMSCADSSLIDTVIFDTRLGFWCGAGNSVVSNVHVYNSGHVTWATANDTFDAAPFGGGYIGDKGQMRLIGAYFDDCTLVIDNPRRVTVVDGLWLLGEATTSGGLILRGAEMRGLTVRNNYISTAASFHTNASARAYVNSTFILLAELDGKVCDGSTADSVFIGNNDYADVAPLVQAGTYRVPSTEARQSLRLENASVWSFDFSQMLLFPLALDWVSATVSQPSAASSPSATTLHYDVLTHGSVVEVVLSGGIRATALVSVEVRQGQASCFGR